MARQLGISPSYMNLLENNQRSLSVKVLMELTDAYGVDWRRLVNDNDVTRLADLRTTVRDPIFGEDGPTCRNCAPPWTMRRAWCRQFLQLHQRLPVHAGDASSIWNSMVDLPDMLATSPETAIHDFFRQHANHFQTLEAPPSSARRRSAAGRTTSMPTSSGSCA